MKKFLSVFILLISVVVVCGQTVTLTFTGRDANNNYCQLEKVVIINQTQNWQETIYWPDTILTMQAGTGIEDYAKEGVFAIMQNNPNPFSGTTETMLNVVETGDVFLELTDVNGRIVETQNFASLQIGNHQFRINVSTAGIYFLTARQNGQTSSIKMVSTGNAAANKIEYQDFVNSHNVETQNSASLQKNNAKGASNNPFSFGDQMEYIGYAIFNGIEVQGWSVEQAQTQEASRNITLPFAALPAPESCPGAATVTDADNNVYNTVQIGQQCWMKENLRVTKYADGTVIALDTNTLSVEVAHRYYPNEDSSTVTTYGYLYNWKAVMGTSASSEANPSNVQGICPTGWHVPSDAEWTQLTSYVKSQPGFVSAGCGGNDDEDYTFCIAKALASTTGWTSSSYEYAPGDNPSSNNLTGFSAFPAGMIPFTQEFFGDAAYFWSSTENDADNAYYRNIINLASSMNRLSGEKLSGNSVRCIKD